MKIATAQNQISADPKKNGREIRALMARASDAGADLIHFPEGALSGYVKSQIKSWDDVDWQVLQEELVETAAVAGDLGLWIVLGANHPLTAPNLPHNSLYVISNTGNVHTRYDKQLCSNSELMDRYTPGQKHVTFEVEGWVFGCALCIEIQFPELFMHYQSLSVDCMLFSSYSDSQMFRTQAQAHAASNNYWFSFSAPVQCSGQSPSCMIGPNGSIVDSCGSLQSGFVISTLDREDPQWQVALNAERPWRRLARAGDIYKSRLVDDPRSTVRTTL